MSKILKRTLTVALICCMLLSVMAPLASAEDPAPTPVDKTYSFTTSKAWAEAGTWDDANEENCVWKGYQRNGTSTIKFTTSGGLQLGTTNSGYYAAVKIYVPETTEYCLMATVVGNTGHASSGYLTLVREDAIYSGDQTVGQKIMATTSASSTSATTLTNVANIGTTYHLNNRITGQASSASTATTTAWANQTPCNYYLGNETLTKGVYLLILSNPQKMDGKQYLRSFRIVESDDATPFVNLVSTNAAEYKNTPDAASYALYTDLVADANLTVGSQRIELAGHSLTVKNLYNVGGNSSVSYKLFAGFTDATSDGSGVMGLVKTTSGNIPVMPHSKTAQDKYPDVLPMYDADAQGYRFVTPTTSFTLKEGVSNPIVNAEEGTAKFVFKVTLPEAAYAMALAENAPLKVTADWTLNGQAQTALSFENYIDDFVDAAGTGVFYVTLAGFDKVADETAVVITPKIAVGNNVIALDAIDYTYTPVA